ncbi:hypothetical protein JDV02_000108 [Purpureocillium takamizusanense]|uniref:Uncharacterized protein n=1 Tax=Purpureocillium takamizusanense TaxID=2060973 RepID=A0A9Q8Q440_9HYPO|nr:uncharacterized protein JDV02_000108 [Purpureocillium takamizusanense]UNI13358.1 hypothetical protein JDV02_000108 [Purpureocillium takamizusanense]
MRRNVPISGRINHINVKDNKTWSKYPLLSICLVCSSRPRVVLYHTEASEIKHNEPKMTPPNSTKPDSYIVARLLRYLSTATLPIGVALLVAHGVKTAHVVPALGLLPLTGSALLAIVSLRRQKTMAVWSPVHRIAAQTILIADFILGLLYLAVLIPSWITLSQRHWRDPTNNSLVILGTYGTVLLLLNLVVHTFFTFAFFLHHMVIRVQRWGQERGGGFSAVWAGPMEQAEEYAPFTDAGARTSMETRADLDIGPDRPSEDA